MNDSSLTSDLLIVQQDQLIPYDELEKCANDSLYCEEQVRLNGSDFFVHAVFALTHIRFDETEAEKRWNQIIAHRELLNSILKRDVGLKVAAIDFFQNIAIKDFNMSVVETEKVKEIAEVAIIDALTGLYVRSVYEEMLFKEFERFMRNKRPLSLIMIDIDDFKKINDTYGHQQGDEVLKYIGEVILKTVRKSDIACRYGGEELSVIMPQTNISTASKVAERIRKRIEKSMINDHISVTVSIGVSEALVLYKAPDEIVRDADAALYKAKEKGKNRVVTADEIRYES